VRLTAQRILSDHLRRPNSERQPIWLQPSGVVDTNSDSINQHWEKTRLDLTGSTLIALSDVACLLGVPGREVGIREHERDGEITAPEGCLGRTDALSAYWIPSGARLLADADGSAMEAFEPPTPRGLSPPPDTSGVSGHEETNVRLPLCAFDALHVISTRRGVSRDEAVRQLLRKHVKAQEEVDPDDRLTHISAVLRYPALPVGRMQPRTDRPLRLRLVPGMALRARAVAFQLPGQYPRAHRDYQARLLTSVMMTAIAVQEPFSDEFLTGLHPLLRHGAALGLWHLAVAVTSTPAENAIRDAAREARAAEKSAARDRLLLVEETLDGEVAWHSLERFTAAANIARALLSGSRAFANEHLLYEQRGDWDAMRQQLRTDRAARAAYLRGVTSSTWIGRGGAAVWRAERTVEMQDFGEWLVNRSGLDSEDRTVNPPGWQIRVPEGWSARTWPSRTTDLPEPYSTWAANQQLLLVPVGAKQAAWPVIPSSASPGWAPVPGVEPLLAPAARLRPEQVIGFIEAITLDWSRTQYPLDIPVQLDIPVHEAFKLGFIDAEERRLIMAEAREATLREMADIISSLTEHQGSHRDALLQAMGDARMFGSIASDLGFSFSVVKATLPWPGTSVAEEFLAGAGAETVKWLANWAHMTNLRLLQQSMQLAWRHAFEHRPAGFWLPDSV
jgi:hypothetical protein